jgi:tight adherence protein C
MTFLLAAIGAAGVLLAVAGMPPLRRMHVSDRVEPYLGGLHGRPSSLLSRPAGSRTGFRARLELRLASVLPVSAEQMTKRLRAAGIEKSAGEFRVEQVTWGLTAMLAVWSMLALGTLAGLGLSSTGSVVLGALTFACGFLARDWWLGRQVLERRSALQQELPTAIDLVTLSIMSGESVPAAFGRVGNILGWGIGEEFRKVMADIRAGSPTLEALETMKERVPGYGIARFVDAISTGIERGAPLADVLRAQADDVREARRRQLLEAGGRREVLMLVPVVFFILPVVVVFALLPGLVALDLVVP